MSKTAKATKLSPKMRDAVALLARDGFVSRSREVGSATIVALMERGILREAGSRSGHLHFPATTPEQVWTAAHEEYDAREAERVAYDDDPERWLTVGDGHTRATRQGGVMTVSRLAYGWHWLVTVDGCILGSAGGSFEEARRAADRFERNQAHTLNLVGEYDADGRHATFPPPEGP